MQTKKSIYHRKRSFAFLTLLITVFYSCNQQPKDGITETYNGNYTIIVIDKCEYIECDYGVLNQRVYSLTHKGNCKFCAERAGY